jgi:hypothetical protein
MTKRFLVVTTISPYHSNTVPAERFRLPFASCSLVSSPSMPSVREPRPSPNSPLLKQHQREEAFIECSQTTGFFKIHPINKVTAVITFLHCSNAWNHLCSRSSSIARLCRHVMVSFITGHYLVPLLVRNDIETVRLRFPFPGETIISIVVTLGNFVVNQ